ncbi:hypothetical protein B0H17DRAFT_1088895 [Mycena rosella]|uniref:MYND-type domain-containing protein n=1 Tax=Mycena rosella TaxID=1033263 RepID=A0AAD7CXP0_MYCRO|nr:hypothetical protein B0H17DRAFT_1088895 [Mycena rosella]
MQQERMPPLPARLGLACYKCFKEEGVRLSRCGGCHRISYCSPECQKLDWKGHKPMCKALSAIENGKISMAAATLFFSLPNEPTTDLNVLDKITNAHGSNMLRFCQLTLKRPATMAEGNIVGWEPRCMVCTRTDQLIRMEAAKNGTTSEPLAHLIPCPQCNISFCCSPAHWEAARALHHGPCEEGHDGLSHCEMNREVRGDVMFEEAIAGAHDESGQFLWAPDRVKAAWSSLAAVSWVTELGDEMRSAIRVPEERSMAPWIRAASDNLTMPMTILYALEQLKEDDAWTRKHTLTIHIIGAGMKEIQGAMVFEEILHRLPEIKTLKLVLCGPELPGNRVPKVTQMDTCPDCTKGGRRRVHEYVADTYHGYVESQGTKFEKPDLCIAFNSGASQESTHTWPATFKLLVGRKIPSVFTAYNREEAVGEAALLRGEGARLHPALGPVKNPWGSIKVIPEPNRIHGFYAPNGWFAGGFQ